METPTTGIDTAGTGTSGLGTWHGLVIDCASPSDLAAFYERLLGYIRVQDEPGWVVIGIAPDRPGIAFQKVESYRAPQWPDSQHPTQMHLDVRVPSLQGAADGAIAAGATLLKKASDVFWVFSDPEGHPFCLVSF